MTITDTEIHHQLTRVMRIRLGDHVVLFDGDGSETEYEVISIDKKSLWLRGQKKSWPHTEPQRHITLYQAMPNKQEKLEYILQKWVEVGISRFVFFRSDHSQKLILPAKKIDRLITIAKEAVEQCGWVKIPHIEFFEKIPEPSVDNTHQLVLDTIGDKKQASEFTALRDIGVWVGPEGWWSEAERIKMSDKGFIFVRFGERVLRTETAGVVVVFSLLYA